MEEECQDLDFAIIEEEDSRLRGGSSYSHYSDCEGQNSEDKKKNM